MGSTSRRELNDILVALVTPWADDRSGTDANRLERHINHLIDVGCHGLVAGGTTGEFTASTLAERKELIELCIKYANGRVPVVAGVGALSTKEAVELATHAETAGAAALMLREFLAEIHKASRLSIVYYNIPSASGLTLKPEEIASLSEIGVHYLKDTSGNASDFTELICGLQHKITAFNGWDTLTFYSLAAGAKGGVWGASNLIPELSVELWDAIAVEGDLKKGRKLWSKIWPICKLLESYNYPPAVKTGMELLGYETVGLRKPFDLLKGNPREEMERLLQNANLKKVNA